MRPSLSSRKPVEDLSVEDLEAFPTWEFADDEEGMRGQDETWVRPLAVSHIPSDCFSLCVAASVRLACGLVYPAVLFADTYEEFKVQAVGLLTSAGRVLLPAPEAVAEPNRELKRLGLSASQVFPLEYSTRAALVVTGQAASGSFGQEGAP